MSKEGFTLEQARAAGAQQFLNLVGYDVGAVDGVVGARTDRGLRRYQKDFGLRADGRLTAELVERMGMALRQAYTSRTIILQSPKR
jgi:peptidoglycan hydrolase-like protein with peptidoglycan-binding domain